MPVVRKTFSLGLPTGRQRSSAMKRLTATGHVVLAPLYWGLCGLGAAIKFVGCLVWCLGRPATRLHAVIR